MDLNLTKPVISAFPGVLQDFLNTFFISVHSTKHGQTIGAGPTNHKTAVIKVLIQSAVAPSPEQAQRHPAIFFGDQL